MSKWIIGGLFLVFLLSRRSAPASSGATAAPQDVLQQIRDQNAAFWASVGAPFNTSSSGDGSIEITAPPDFAPGFSATPFSDPGFNGT